MTVMARSQGSDSALFISPMHNAQTDSKQQAINGVEDSLPGYVKEYIYFNGHLVGYKWEKVEKIKGRRWYQTISSSDLIRKLKWNW